MRAKSEFQLEARSHGQAHDARKADVISFSAGDEERKNEFDISFDRQQLADYLCVDRSAMSAQLCALRDDGILKFKKNHFILNRI